MNGYQVALLMLLGASATATIVRGAVGRKAEPPKLGVAIVAAIVETAVMLWLYHGAGLMQ
jgi:hypothetical protein